MGTPGKVTTSSTANTTGIAGNHVSDSSLSESIVTLVDWAVSHGATLHPSVEVYHDAHTGLSFRVKPSASRALPPYEPIVRLPTALTLSYLNAVEGVAAVEPVEPVPPPLHPDILSRAPPHVVGRLFLIHEYLKGRESLWWPYIQALPQPGPGNRHAWALAPFWDPDDAELLDGTNVEVGMAKIRRDVEREFSHARELLSPCAPATSLLNSKTFTPDLYQWAYCIFSSRSFRPSLVLSDTQLRMLPAAVAVDDFSVLLPLFDVGNHDMTTPVQWHLDQDRQQCTLCVGSTHAPGQQIFNNYSMKTNAELLLGYGFMIPATDDLHNDYIHVRKRRTTTKDKDKDKDDDPDDPDDQDDQDQDQDQDQLQQQPCPSDEYLISLRPLSHPSTLLARAKQSLRLDPSTPILGSFQHLQPEMVWDILCTLTTPDQRRELLSPGGLVPEGHHDQDSFHRHCFFSGQVPGPARPYLQQTIAIIQHQLLRELERLTETDVEFVSGDAADLTRNQRLALDYRDRCRRVLEAVLEAIGGDADIFDDE
ncbi:hypothetical protein E4U43_008205 [Claviceps pusilla]|uniref:SET domain-containing protein n=1 Tax=Claviceps pusilla TaxID=123648 RepID=A0A9P7NB98_9HYPO|nr:hypothetical protein E4U43_008205 [Claviceps pusilla]